MLNKLWTALRSGSNLIDDAKKNSLIMLTTAREMYHMALSTIDAESKYMVRAQLARMDKQINHEQREIRKKVFEHLSLSRGKNLLPGLQLVSISIDLERLGDYLKNIGELIDMIPGKLTFGEYQEDWETLKTITTDLFELTKAALIANDEQKGAAVMRQYNTISKTCDETIQEIFEKNAADQTLSLHHLSTALMFRYMKRVAAHLKNICSAIVNPFHRIGFRA